MTAQEKGDCLNEVTAWAGLIVFILFTMVTYLLVRLASTVTQYQHPCLDPVLTDFVCLYTYEF
jgi:hypothetical protein